MGVNDYGIMKIINKKEVRMKIKKQKLLKKENGITLVALITTIIVLSIVSTPLIFGTNNITEYSKFSKFKNECLLN